MALLFSLPALAHNGDEHGNAPVVAAAGPRYFTTTAASAAFELVLRYPMLRAAAPAELRLFVSDFATNAPIHGARLTLSTTGMPAVTLTATEAAPGDYRLTGQFPKDRAYDLTVQVVAPDGRADLLLLKPVEVGKEPPGALADDDHDAHDNAATWSASRVALVGLGGLLLGAGLMAFVLRRPTKPSASSPSDPQ